MLSMTGFGKGSACRGGNEVEVEITAVNHRKQTEVRLSMPVELAALEADFRNVIRKEISRGSLTVAVRCVLNAELRRQKVRLDQDVAARVIEDLRAMAKTAGISDEVRIGELLAVPGIVYEHVPTLPGQVAEAADEALRIALEDLRRMQALEGEALRQDLSRRREALNACLQQIRKQAHEVLERHRERLHERIAHLGIDLKLDDERLAKEVAFVAERADITEEIVRLESHLQQFDDLLGTDRAAGRQLEFLAQEMHREVSTICAKACDTGLANLALSFKTELGSVREQVQNLE